ncbi:uncharacterized protein A4U43_C02F210 [Asparagus officinalis]|uniref:Transcription factor MYBS1 n=1 Tax=Asparagus officinalis TaxID=4686 RepID=A0A5P1FFJ0_ASPOF|nr:transcription factor DIVARICATA [Asparagus officinalis]ONK76824.1 uncharacterized protein A4U43_C02F210 [Asparagus officinalis]
MMTRSGMEVLSPASSYFTSSSWILGEKRSGSWTQQENKIFENALAHVDSKTPDRWERVAAMIPGKTVRDVVSHYKDLEADVNHIEAGLIPFPGYSSPSFVLDWEGGFDGLKQKRPGGGGRFSDQERKKGVPWTEEEHKLFLMGLKKYGKGDWRNISRNFVVTRTPTQVASHAQKYFIRLNSGGKDKRRASIHDITTVNLPETSPSSSPSQPSALTMQSTSSTATERSDQNDQASCFSSSFRQLPFGVDPYGIKLEAHQNHHTVAHRAMLI